MSRVSLSLMQRYASVELDNEVSEIGQLKQTQGLLRRHITRGHVTTFSVA